MVVSTSVSPATWASSWTRSRFPSPSKANLCHLTTALQNKGSFHSLSLTEPPIIRPASIALTWMKPLSPPQLFWLQVMYLSSGPKRASGTPPSLAASASPVTTDFSICAFSWNVATACTTVPPTSTQWTTTRYTFAACAPPWSHPSLMPCRIVPKPNLYQLAEPVNWNQKYGHYALDPRGRTNWTSSRNM